MGRALGIMGAWAGAAVPGDGGLLLAVGALFWLVGAQVCIEAEFRLGRVVLCCTGGRRDPIRVMPLLPSMAAFDGCCCQILVAALHSDLV